MQGGCMPGDHLTELAAEHVRVSNVLNRVEGAIELLERAPHLRADAAARLESYRRSVVRLHNEMTRLWFQIEQLRSSLDTEVRAPVMLNDELLKRVQQEEATESQRHP
jgi:hypothetical protein